MRSEREKSKETGRRGLRGSGRERGGGEVREGGEVGEWRGRGGRVWGVGCRWGGKARG